ncbi:hypothetical protein ACELLULO517_12740 [Acidisoma cellulosilytica]|uniref:Uncharacterized protein n=1 Tax=Acidisoma cellulosilyticum TaxID=2802395 RepID=A0A963Z1X1_9PROT|nr:hypothetical protein [Acidisoma cellulosilyticum]MCB8881106.1 hypothetical protein [Acidisoma cellulosilyticum]
MAGQDQAIRDVQAARPGTDPIYAELWGDVVDLRHLAGAMVIGAVISLAIYILAGFVFASFVAKPSVAHAYAMLAGLVGCVVGGTVCAWRFKPKRQMVEEDDIAWRQEAIALLEAESGPLGLSAHLTPAVEREMRALGLLDVANRAARGEVV